VSLLERAPLKTVDESMWQEVKAHYEAAYKNLRFTAKPSEKNIKILYDKMKQLHKEAAKYGFAKDPFLCK